MQLLAAAVAQNCIILAHSHPSQLQGRCAVPGSSFLGWAEVKYFLHSLDLNQKDTERTQPKVSGPRWGKAEIVGAGLSSQGINDKITGNSLKLCQEWFRWDIGNHFIPRRVGTSVPRSHHASKTWMWHLGMCFSAAG